LGEFEFVSVLISMIVGLAIAQLLSGFGQAVHERKQAPLDEVHMVWTAVVFLNLVLNWWVLFSWREHEVWSFLVFVSLIVWAVVLYLLVEFLYPARKPATEAWTAVYASNRQWFLATFAAFGVADICLAALRGGLWDPPEYLPFVLHYMVLFLAGVFVGKPRYQRFLAWYILISLTLWAFVARRFLS
jgi:hypothetical protein